MPEKNIAAPAAQHHTLATQALDAGKHCFVEKPLSLTYETVTRNFRGKTGPPPKGKTGATPYFPAGK